MIAKPKVVTVSPGSELDRLLDEAESSPILLERNGRHYRLSREAEALWEGYDPERVREAIAASAGSWAGVDADALIADLYRAREEGSRGADRP
jgi:hypothetical protein